MSNDADRLTDLMNGYMHTFLIAGALRLELPDRLGDASMTVGTLADVSGTHAPALRRMLRALAALGLLHEEAVDTYRLTGTGALLRGGVPGSLRGLANIALDETMWRAWPELEVTMRTGERAFDYVFGTDYLSHTNWYQRSELRGFVDHAMREHTRAVAAAVVASYDFAEFDTVVDIGGGSGALAATILAANPALRGIVLDLADGLVRTDETLQEAGVADRCEIRVGDFRAGLPAADLYVCKSVVFNYADDETVSTLLRNCRDVVHAQGRLLLIEEMLPDTVDGSLPARSYLGDLNSMLNLGGRLRTEREYLALLTGAGFSLTVHPLPPEGAGHRVLEAAPS